MSAILTSPAPTGRNISTRGKARSATALGHAPQNTSSPEAAKATGELPDGPANQSTVALAKVESHQFIGEQLPKLLDELNEVLSA